MRPATPGDRESVASALRKGLAAITWPDDRTLRAWAKEHGWPAPSIGFKDAFVTKMLESDETFALALSDSGIKTSILVQDFTLPPEDLYDLDRLYAARSADGRPSDWGVLVEALREIRRAVEAGVAVEIEGKTCRDWGSFYEWAHGRYHMLEDGYDAWIGDDR